MRRHDASSTAPCTPRSPEHQAPGALRGRWASPRLGAALLGAALAAGCVGDRMLVLDSVPTGADVRLDDRLIGVTPLRVPFQHYGQRRLALYKDGYRTYSEPLRLKAPWWARFPVDIFTEVILPLGLDDVREITIDLVPDTGSAAALATEEFLKNAQGARSGENLVDVPIAGQRREP